MKSLRDLLRGLWIGRGGFAKNLAIIVVSLTIFLVVWEIGSVLLDTTYLPSPLVVWDALVDSFQNPDPASGVDMWQNIGASLRRFVIGFCMALGIAVPLGLIMGFSKWIGALGKPVVEVFRPIPPIAWVPFLFVVMGMVWGPIIAIFIGVFFPVLSNVIFGVKSVDPQLIDAGKTLGASKSDIFAKVVFPYTIPFLMTGIRIGLGIGWMCIVAAEMIGAKGGGVGLYILNQANIGRYEYMFAGMVVIAVLGLVTTEAAFYIENKVSKWMGAR
ncbi:MAG: ABC transporter permease [Methanomassiliicoccales archaeon]|nr:MAG: ABC transporter permease [Methanomassiliicoccales archaeon]